MSCALRRILPQLRLLERASASCGRRTLLSEAYTCQEAWEKRLHSPILSKVEPEEFAVMIQEKIEKKGFASNIDFDILANKLELIDPIQIDFMQTLFKRFRHHNSSIDATESTSHAVIRAYLKLDMTDRLLHMLEDKKEYGIFLDAFSSNLLLDHFIEARKYEDAARIAYDLMLQEDFSNPITKMLSWYACHQHWKSFVPVKSEPVADDEEEEWVRVDYITRPWYDDHFDLPREELKLGKTFAMLASGDDVMNRSYKVIGLSLWEKFGDALDLLEQWRKSDTKICITPEALEQLKTSLNSYETKEHPAEEKELALMTIEDCYPYFTQEQKEEFLGRFEKLEESLSSGNRLASGLDMGEEILGQARVAVAKNQDADIARQVETFSEWEETRNTLLQQQIGEFKTQRQKADLAQRLRDLQEQEEKLSYFELYDKIQLWKERREIQEAEALKRQKRPVKSTN